MKFDGGTEGTGELTWGQQGIWATMQKTGRTLNIGGAVALPAGMTAEDVADILRFIVTRHEALRTRLRFVPGQRYPQQVVAADGEITLHVADVEAGHDAAQAAEVLRVAYELEPFDYEHEFPVRMAVVRQQGYATHLVVQYCHIAVDGNGIDVLVRDLAVMPDLDAPLPGITPLVLAAEQQGQAALRASRKSLRHWESILRTIPAHRYGNLRPVGPQEPRFWEIFCYSPAMHLALKVVARRVGVDTSHVLLASFAVAFASITGQPLSVTQAVVNNRFRPQLGGAVTQLCQNAITVVDTDGADFDEIVARAWKAATSANLCGYYDSAAYDQMLARIADERGEDVDVSCFINDRRMPDHDGDLPTPMQVRAALDRTVVRFDRQQPVFDGRFFLQIDSAPDANVPGRLNPRESELPAVYFALWADTRYIPPAQMEAFARTFEAVTVQAALSPSAAAAIAVVPEALSGDGGPG